MLDVQNVSFIEYAILWNTDTGFRGFWGNFPWLN